MTQSTAPTSSDAMPVDWSDEVAEVSGRPVRYRSAGRGPVLLVVGTNGVPAEAVARLSADHHVVVPELMTTGADVSARQLGSAIAAFAAALDLGSAAVLGTGIGADAALWAAVDNPALVSTLILAAPTVFSDAAPADPHLVDALPACEVPTLVLLGQADPVSSPRFAADYKRLPASSVALVYAAGADVMGERPDAFVATVSDYLRRGQAFVLSNASTLIHA